MKNKFLGALALVATLYAAPALAVPQTVSFSGSLPLTSTNFSGQAIALQQFDPGLGTLLSAEFDFTGLVSGTGTATNNDAAPADIFATLSAIMTLTGPGTLSVNAVPVFSQTFTAVAPGDTVNISGSNSASNSQTLFSGFGSIIGLGTYNTLVAANATSSASGPGNVQSSFSTSASASVTVTYTYDNEVQIAEPTTLALLGAGLIGAGLRRRRKA